MGFAKLDDGILKSSIMAERPEIFKVFIALLASSNWEGLAKVSPIFLASACHLSQEVVDRALERLSSPDKYSRSSEEEGRRIKRVEGGFLVINYKKYRAFTYSDSPESVRKREYRKRVKKKDILGQDGTSPGRSASVSASASASASEELRNISHLFDKLWKDWPEVGRFKKRICREKFTVLYKRGEFETFRKATLGYSNYLLHKKENEGFAQNAMHLVTWLNNWEEESGRYVDKDGNPFRYKARL